MFLENRNSSSKIKRSKVTDYAALNRNIQNIFRQGEVSSSGGGDVNAVTFYE